MRVLICDDEENIRNLLGKYLILDNFDVEKADNGVEAQRLLRESDFDAVVVDLKMPGMDGIQLMHWMRDEGYKIPIIMVSAHGEISDAVKALKLGAYDYIEKPFDPADIASMLRNLMDSHDISDYVEKSKRIREIQSTFLGDSPEVKKIREVIKRISPSTATVLITGESGTGKEVVARDIHSQSAVSNGPFVAINIGGVPDNLLESELFGYEKGAFTGAVGKKVGMFELASGGTLFLDEIGDMPLSLQVKILRVLQERKITRLGSTVPIQMNARIVAATNKNLDEMVKKGLFREDLYYRLNVVRVHIPPLRERKEDIPVLSAAILAKYNEMMGTNVKGFSPDAIGAMKKHDFYGNVRELENVIERSMIFADGPVIEVRDLDLRPSVFHTVEEEQKKEQNPQTEERISLRNAEKNAIIHALQRWHGNRTKAAEELGVSRRTLISKIAEYNIDL